MLPKPLDLFASEGICTLADNNDLGLSESQNSGDAQASE
jgi:hypothetical protein